MNDALRRAITRALRLSIPLDESEYAEIAERVASEIQRSEPAEILRGELGSCRYVLVARMAEKNGNRWHGILSAAIELAGAPACECQHCTKGSER